MESEHSLLIFYDVSAGKDALLAAVEEYGATIFYEYRNINAIAIRIPEGTFIGDAIEFFKNIEGVISVRKDAKVDIDF